MRSPAQIQRSPSENCTDAQVATVNSALSQALLDLDVAISLLEPRPLSRRAQDAMWLTFRDTDDLKAFIATEYLRMIKDRLPSQQIECEQVPYHLDDCKEGAGSGTTNSGRGYTYLCMGYWDNSSKDRERTLIHEVAHRFIFKGGDPGYFDPVCNATSQTMKLSIAQRFRNADSYSCLAYLLARETAEALRSRVLREKGEPPPAMDKSVATISFGTGSNEPDHTALATFASQLASHQVSLNLDEYHIDFDGYASRTGDDDYNQILSEQRAQAVKVRLESLLGAALGDPDFKFAPAQTTVEGHGEERAREAGKPPNDDSPADRVVDVVFEAM
jgi:outer membrane protein OmpA-like peptidoglycan-associated protein